MVRGETRNRGSDSRDEGARRRVVAVGTTTTRTLESAAQTGDLRPFCGETGLFIYAPFEFRVIDALVTNFHLPRHDSANAGGCIRGE